LDEWLARWSHVLWINVLLQIQMTADYSVYKVGWADKEWSSTNHKYNKHRPSSRLSKGIAKHFLVFEMSLGSNSEVLISMKLKIQTSRHY
jgi:hypothetical protein